MKIVDDFDDDVDQREKIYHAWVHIKSQNGARKEKSLFLLPSLTP